MIDTMTVTNILTEYDEYIEQDVISADIEFMMPDEYVELRSINDPEEYVNQFFFLACDYLESYVKDIESTDEAKIGIWYPKRKKVDSLTDTPHTSVKSQGKEHLI